MSSRGRRSNVRACFQEPEHGANIHPAILKQARKSGQLNLSGRGLTEVPETVWKINVDVPPESRNVSMENQDDRWWEQTDLTKLILASNAITDLTDNIQMLPALTVLDLHDNQLTSLPETIGTLVNLQKLNASHNGIKGLPQSIGHLKNLRLLQVHHNQITEISDNIGELHDLEELDISNNKLTNLPLGIRFLTRVLHFNFANNQVKVLPHEIGSMQALRTLDATHNVIHTLPEELGDLRHLEQLYLRHNKLTHLPVLRHCTNLKELHLGNNALQSLAVENLECIPQLCVLDLRDNKISRIPDQITVLQELERLDVSNNDISQLPFTLGTMVKLKCIVLDGNPMKSIRRDIVMRGTNELKKYLRSRLAEPENDVTEKTQGLRKSKGMSGIISGTQEGIDAFSIHNTKSLDYSGKGASQIPTDLWPVAEAARVNTVNFNKNLLQTVPQELSSLSSSLTELYLAFNKLTSLDAIIGELTKLMMLDISINVSFEVDEMNQVFRGFSSSIQNNQTALLQLRHSKPVNYLLPDPPLQDLQNNQISSLPDSLVNLQDLRELVISFNKFKELPKVVYNLSSLEILLANDNQIQTVDPDGVKGLSRLSSLNLQNNDIMNVPPELGLCTQLRALQLEGNPFRHPRPAILLKGTDALLEYLRNRIVA